MYLKLLKACTSLLLISYLITSPPCMASFDKISSSYDENSNNKIMYWFHISGQEDWFYDTNSNETDTTMIANSSKTVTDQPTSIDHFLSIDDDFIQHIINFMPLKDRWPLMFVSKRFNCLLTNDLIVNDPYLKITPYSSEMYSNEDDQSIVGELIMDIIKQAQKSIIIASDKCTNEEFLNDLLELPKVADGSVKIRIVTGDDGQTFNTLDKKKFDEFTVTHVKSKKRGNKTSGRMHNKFIVVDDHTVITGSPNLTYAAYKYNIESFVAIHHHFIAHLYNRYYQYLINGQDKYNPSLKDYRIIERMLGILDNSSSTVKVCLAPICDLKDFFVKDLKSSSTIDINMFLVSRATQPKDDVVDTLIQEVRNGAKLTLKVDADQYKDNDYMQNSLKPLCNVAKDNGCNVSIYTVQKKSEQWQTRTRKITTKPQFHDKLILIQQKDNIKKVFTGSAGFTDNVQDNQNLENMVLIKDNIIYDKFLTKHFNTIKHYRKLVVNTIVESKKMSK